jgi:mRNA-degrading endonuclease RelE of RelBE toxin-antitoxin system
MHGVAESHEFRTQARKLLTEEEIVVLISLLASDPKAGDLIAGTGGFRKLRFARQGGGKRGGYRVVYFYYDERLPVLLASVYAKNEKEGLTKAQRNQLAAVATHIKQTVRS